MSSPEVQLSEIREKARQAENAYQQSLALIQAKRSEAATAVKTLKEEFGVSSLTEADALIESLTVQMEQDLARARELIQS